LQNTLSIIKENSRSDDSGSELFWELVALFCFDCKFNEQTQPSKNLGTFYSQPFYANTYVCVNFSAYKLLGSVLDGWLVVKSSKLGLCVDVNANA
jgi:hypothetical protein